MCRRDQGSWQTPAAERARPEPVCIVEFTHVAKLLSTAGAG